MTDKFYYQAEYGFLSVSIKNNKLHSINFMMKNNDVKKNFAEKNIKESPLHQQTYRQIKEYFYNQRKEFQLPFQIQGTEFQRKVWRATQGIPYGQTRTYQQIAAVIGNKKACRAVGNALQKNPLLIVIPCHRVICSDGRTGGYAGGPELKQKLLALEKDNITGCRDN